MPHKPKTMKLTIEKQFPKLEVVHQIELSTKMEAMHHITVWIANNNIKVDFLDVVEIADDIEILSGSILHTDDDAYIIHIN